MIFSKISFHSGGQACVDRAALDFALKYRIVCTRWYPAGRLSEDGVIPIKYPFKESQSTDYKERTLLKK